MENPSNFLKCWINQDWNWIFNECVFHFEHYNTHEDGANPGVGNGDVLAAVNIDQEPENNVAAEIAGEVNSNNAAASDVAHNKNSKYAQFILYLQKKLCI